MNIMGLGDPIGFESLEEGRASQRKLASLSFEAAGFGHGEPIARDASTRFRNKWGKHPEEAHQQRPAAQESPAFCDQFIRSIYDVRRQTDVPGDPHHSTDDPIRWLFSVDVPHEQNERVHGESLRQNFFRAGHAHAGVIVILSLVCQILADSAFLSSPLVWLVRIGVPLAAILISAGFFFRCCSLRLLRLAEQSD